MALFGCHFALKVRKHDSAYSLTCFPVAGFEFHAVAIIDSAVKTCLEYVQNNSVRLN